MHLKCNLLGLGETQSLKKITLLCFLVPLLFYQKILFSWFLFFFGKYFNFFLIIPIEFVINIKLGTESLNCKLVEYF